MTTAVSGVSGPGISFSGIESGITTAQVVSALLGAYQVPVTDLEDEQATLRGEVGDYRALSTAFQSVLNAAQSLSTGSAWDLAKAVSSDTSVATATAGAGAQTGSLTFTVNQLAQANVLASTSGVSSQGEIVTSSASMLVATGAPSIGFATLAAGPTLALGSYTIKVTQSSTAARISGAGALATSTTITTANDTLSLTVDGTAKTLTIASGAYSPTGLVAALNAAAASAGAKVAAALASTGALELRTTRQGSAASLGVTGGTALGSLGLTTGTSGRGTNAVVTIGGTTTTLTSITAGQTVALGAPSAQTLSATVASGSSADGSLVTAGTAQAAEVSTGNGSLSTVVASINASGLAATAIAVETSSGSYLLQVSADRTGVAGAVSVDAGAFAGSPLGPLESIATAQTATASVGGARGYTVSSSTDTFTNLMAGATISALATGTVTVSVSQDATGEAARVQALVTAANAALADIQKYAGYTTQTKTGGPLMGSAVLEDVKTEILSTIASTTGTSSLGNLADVGLSVTKTGTVAFTKAKFVSAFETRPAEVMALFTQGGTFSPSAAGAAGEVRFAFAGTGTEAGSYSVEVSHSATQAVDTGATLPTGKVSVAETLTVTMGTSHATYTTSAGESLTAIAAGLNQGFAAAGMPLTTKLVGGTSLVITSNGYGSAATFSVASSAAGAGTTGLGAATAGTERTSSGTDVAGSIGGIAATGSGQVLTAAKTSPLDGLSVMVSPGVPTTTTLGTISYAPGAAQRLASAMNAASNAQTGAVTAAIKSLTTEVASLSAQVQMYQRIENSQKALLEQEFSRMTATLGSLKNESAMLQSELTKLPVL